MMNDLLAGLAALIGGLAAGTIFFAGLWWTVRRLPSSRHPALLSLSSFSLRTAAALGVFYLAGQDRWDRLLICLGGFLLARLWITRRIRPSMAAEGRAGAGRLPTTTTDG
jgi:F1F0 ATPase subunit 2